MGTVDFSSKSSLNFVFICLLWLYPSLSDYHLLLIWTMIVISCWSAGPQSGLPLCFEFMLPLSTGPLQRLQSQFTTPSAWVAPAQP